MITAVYILAVGFGDMPFSTSVMVGTAILDIILIRPIGFSAEFEEAEPAG